ncbi:hypothetical protein DID88_001133 [Monilinia fructigena]|uniref:FAD/NAD(P)-binding domain-containing protein n=1 Tax=Monilinia fructigena TaxID=38457 RepID=A0A395IXN1_9HELO|nr:hypothetical protein DID88_001133 [Monilinia fructigena]
MGPVQTEEVDVLLVGAGFGSFIMLNKLRNQGLKCRIYEKGPKSGGVCLVLEWIPILQFINYSTKNLWEDFTFKEKFAGGKEIRRYFEHVEKKWDDLHLVALQPPLSGLSNYKGDVYHTAIWPQHDVNLKNKRVGQIGTGASGIQVIQTIGPIVKHLTVYQRTPNFALPMNQGLLDPEEEVKKKAEGKYEEEFAKTRNTLSGFTYTIQDKDTFDDTPEEREAFFHKLLIEQGGLRFWLNNYKDILFHLTHGELKRPCLEQNIWEVFSLPHIDIIDVNESPIIEVTEKGVRTKGGEVEFDVLILATGFDSMTGSLAQLNIQGTDGHMIAQKWKDGTRTSMGIAMNKYPNMFFLYGPQAPTAFSNGLSCIQFQAEYVADTIRGLVEKDITYFEARREAEENWYRRMSEVWNASLFPLAKSWYQGANIPGKKVEPLSWAGGMPEYRATLARSNENGYQGWIVE